MKKASIVLMVGLFVVGISSILFAADVSRQKTICDIKYDGCMKSKDKDHPGPWSCFVDKLACMVRLENAEKEQTENAKKGLPLYSLTNNCEAIYNTCVGLCGDEEKTLYEEKKCELSCEVEHMLCLIKVETVNTNTILLATDKMRTPKAEAIKPDLIKMGDDCNTKFQECIEDAAPVAYTGCVLKYMSCIRENILYKFTK
jgi:hypothetical protein